MGQYDIAQICENGHIITSMFQSYPEFGRKFCQECGAPTIIACPKCSKPIRGYYRVEGFLGSSEIDLPNFCGECGAPYPWTETALSELHEIARMVEGLRDEERDRLEAAIDDLVRDSPRTERAVLIVKTIAPKLGQEAWGAMKALLVSVATEAAKRGMGL
jgi:hypothetical protein